jgi:D-3-phosphoglycerate dehydrogenase
VSPSNPHIIFTEKYEDWAMERMRSVGRVTLLPDHEEATLLEAVGDCDALLVRTRTRVTRAVMKSTSRLKVIGRAGVGLDNIDLTAARTRGIVVVHTPYAATDAVADLTVGLMISLLRRIQVGDAGVRAGRFFETREAFIGTELRELTLGIVGMGRIGQAAAQRCRHGFGMTILYNDIIRAGHLEVVATAVGKQELYERSDVVSLHVPLTPQTTRMIDARALTAFKKGSVLINTSRGGVVDHYAAAAALSSGQLAGAALDVFDPEPLPPDHPLRTAPNTLFTPHIGARSHGGLHRMNEVVEDVIAVLEGRPPLHPARTPG